MNRTIVNLIAAHPIGGAELADLGLDLVLLRLLPAEVPGSLGHTLQVGDDQRAYRGIALRGGDPGIAVYLIRNRNRDVFHVFTVTQ